MPWWAWIVLGVSLLAVEVVLTTDYFLVFFGASALLVGLVGVTGLHLPIWVQWLMFAVATVVALMLYRRRLRDALERANAVADDTFKGQDALVTEVIAVGATGSAELSGSRWTARNLGPDPLAPGDKARVETVQELTLHVRRVV
jgi:membrane protein implicated in regulation of membrane protease activity